MFGAGKLESLGYNLVQAKP